MFREIEPRSVNQGALRHPDGSINFDAYRERAACANRGYHRLDQGRIVADVRAVRRQARADSQASRDVMRRKRGATV